MLALIPSIANAAGLAGWSVDLGGAKPDWVQWSNPGQSVPVKVVPGPTVSPSPSPTPTATPTPKSTTLPVAGATPAPTPSPLPTPGATPGPTASPTSVARFDETPPNTRLAVHLEGSAKHLGFVLGTDRKLKDRVTHEDLGEQRFRLTVFLQGPVTQVEVPLIADDGKLMRWKIEVTLPSFADEEYKRAYPRRFRVEGGPYLGYAGGYSTELLDTISVRSAQAVLPLIGGEVRGTWVREYQKFHYAMGFFGEFGFQFLNLDYKGTPLYLHGGWKHHFRNIWAAGGKADFRIHALLGTRVLGMTTNSRSQAGVSDSTVVTSTRIRWFMLPWIDVAPVFGISLGRFALEMAPRLSYMPYGTSAIGENTRFASFWGWGVGASFWAKLPVWKLFAQADLSYSVLRGRANLEGDSVTLDVSPFSYSASVGIWF